LKDEIDMLQIRILAATSTLPNWPIAWTKKSNPAFGRKGATAVLTLNDPAILKLPGLLLRPPPGVRLSS
jgi:ABC-type phosphate/phosphonate transport system substrate-binding protein